MFQFTMQHDAYSFIIGQTQHRNIAFNYMRVTEVTLMHSESL